MLLPTGSENETEHRKVPMLEIEKLYRKGYINFYDYERAKIFNDYQKDVFKNIPKENIYLRIAEKYSKSFYRIRNIILELEKKVP